MAQAILFDFWGTLAENGVWSPIKQVRTILQLRVPFPEYVLRMEKVMMASPCDNVRTAFERVCKEFRIVPEETLLDELVGMWNKNWMLAKPYPETLDVLQRLKKGSRLILISNTDSISIPNVLKKYGLNSCFDAQFLSCDMGLLKSEPQFLQKVAEELRLPPAECVVVGDSLQSDMEPARYAGMKAVLIDRKNSRDFAPRIQNLGELEGALTTL